MTIELEKSKLEPVLLTISTFDANSGILVGGLLKENLTLGTKRKLQKIHKGVYKAYQEFVEDVNSLKKECGEDKEKLEKELKELLEEVVKIDVEKIQFSLLENVPTTENYNFDIIDKITM